jgi:hypothetical protein
MDRWRDESNKQVGLAGLSVEIMLRRPFLRNPTFPGWLLGYAGIGLLTLSAKSVAR